MKILFNHVLVKPEPNDAIYLANNVKLFFDSRFEEYKAAPQVGEVIAVPDRLRFSHNLDYQNSLDIETTMELKVGDRIIFNYGAIPYARLNGMEFTQGIFVRYDMVYIAMRGDEIIPVSGSVIVEPEKETHKTSLIIPDAFKGQPKSMVGKVVLAGEPHTAERGKPEKNILGYPMWMGGNNNWGAMNRYCQPGDRVIFHFSNAIPLQHYYEINGALSRTLSYRMKHSDIEIVVDPSVEIESL